MQQANFTPLRHYGPVVWRQWVKRTLASEATKPAPAPGQEHQATATTTITMPTLEPPPPPSSTHQAESTTTTETKMEEKALSYTDPPDLFIKLDTLEPITQSEALRKSMSFDEVPGPKALRHLARFWSFVPVIGTQVTASAIQYLLSAGKLFGSQLSWGSNRRLFKWLMDEYGPVVRLHGPFGGDVVILSRPEHASAVFQNEGRYPMRSCLDCVEKYRLQFRRYKQAGPFLMYGPEWEKLRKAVEQPLQDSTIQQYDQLEQSCSDFITRILRIRNRQEEVPATFKNEIYKWALDCTCSMILNKRLGFLDPCGLSSTSEPARMLEGLHGATEAIRNCETGLHLWKFMDTPAWKSLIKHCDVLDSILNKYIRKAQDSLRQKKTGDSPILPEKVTLLESLLVKDSMLPEDVLTLLLDMVLIGVNTVSHSAAFLMYHLARNPRVQRKLYMEVKSCPQHMKKADLAKLEYLYACIRECLRLQPPMPILSRILSNDILVHNYRIPKGTYMLIATHLSSMREEYFEDPQRFRPERWIEDFCSEVNNLAALPFGHGPKACLARDLAETEIAALMIKLLQKFKIEYHYGDINSTNRLIAAPDRPLKFRFVEREEM